MNTRDLTAAALVAALGVFTVVMAFVYGIGSFARMGAGFFPLALGSAAVLLAIAIAVPALSRADRIAVPSWRPLAGIAAGIAVFALAVERFGVLPAVFAAAAIVAAADRDSRPVEILLLAVAMTVIIWLVFLKLLAIPVDAVRLP